MDFVVDDLVEPVNCWVMEIVNGGKIGFEKARRERIPMTQEIIVCADCGFADRWYQTSQGLVVAVSPFIPMLSKTDPHLTLPL